MNRGAELLGAARGTQREKAERLGISQAYVCLLAAGKRLPPEDIRKTLLKTYQIPPKAWDEPAREGAVEGAEDKGDDWRRHAAPSKSPQEEQSATIPSR